VVGCLLSMCGTLDLISAQGEWSGSGNPSLKYNHYLIFSFLHKFMYFSAVRVLAIKYVSIF
jgi:hypothetical protein